jgi:uncharacterized membrane protein
VAVLNERPTLQERGQMMLVAGLSLAVLLGFTAMSIDVGMAYRDRRDLQNDADAAVLAGVVHLPGEPNTAKARAREWLAKNGVTPEQITSVEVRRRTYRTTRCA